MDVENLFDFDNFSGKDLGGAANTIPDCDQEIQRLEKASSEGDLHTVRYVFDDLRSSPAGEYWVKGPGSSLFLAVQNRRNAVVEYLLAQGVSLGVNHVRIATLNKDTALLELFLMHGWNINERMGWASPPPLALAVQDAKLVAWFLSHGADPNAACQLDLTPLSAAAELASFDVIETLFDHGGLIDEGQLMHYAARRDQLDSPEVLAYLLNKGAPINDVIYQHRVDCYRLQEA